MSFIKINNVSYSYLNTYKALDDVSLTIEKGESIAIIGQNGAGKSTLVKLINGLLKPDSGTILINDNDTKNYTIAQCAKMVGYVFQNPDQQLFEKSIEAEVSVGPKAFGYDKYKIEQIVRFSLDLTDLYDVRSENPYNFSLSKRKMISIASVLAMDTEIIILDEPTAGQDNRAICLLETMIKELKRMKKTIILITHDMEFAGNNFDRIIVMADRKVISDNDAYNTFTDEEILKKGKIKAPIIFKLQNKLEMNEIREYVELLNN